MKKITFSLIIITLAIFLIFSGKVLAAPLSTLSVDTSKDTVHPGETVTLYVDFGELMGAYTVYAAYDSNLFEYVSSTGGTASDNGSSVTVLFYDPTVGAHPSSIMSITFKAKTTINTSNPTNFAVTADGLANPYGTVIFDDITTPIISNIVVEPAYENYAFAFNYTGDITEDEEKDINLSYSSPIGRYYDHVRINVEVTGPTGSTVNLIGKDASLLDHDLVQNGWGDASGFGIGGNVNETLALKGTFSEVGNYTVKFNLIDRDASDAIIATNTFNVTAQAKQAPGGNNTTNNTTTNNTVTNNVQNSVTNTTNNNTNTALPTKLPQTGSPILTTSVLIMIVALAGYIFTIVIKKARH